MRTTTPNRPNRKLSLTTRDHLAAGGDALANAADGRVVFVEGAGPNETVEAQVVQENATFLRAKVTRVEVCSQQRVPPKCAAFGRCGGCTLQHLNAAYVATEKQFWVTGQIERVGKIALNTFCIDPIWTGEAFHYRSRARLVASADGTLGYRQVKSNQILAIETCHVLSPRLELERKSLQGNLPPGTEVELVEADNLVLVGTSKAPGPSGWSDDQHTTRVQPWTFSQSHRLGNEAMRNYLQLLLRTSGTRALEIYSGNGNFTSVLAPRFQSVIAIEVAENSVNLARHIAQPNVECRVEPVEAALRASSIAAQHFELMLANPPRTGLSKEVTARIQTMSFDQFVYVSCNPATFARDAGELQKAGLKLERLRPFDLYPQTPHVELIATFHRS